MGEIPNITSHFTVHVLRESLRRTVSAISLEDFGSSTEIESSLEFTHSFARLVELIDIMNVT